MPVLQMEPQWAARPQGAMEAPLQEVVEEVAVILEEEEASEVEAVGVPAMSQLVGPMLRTMMAQFRVMVAARLSTFPHQQRYPLLNLVCPVLQP